MTEQKHTPGPWETRQAAFGREIFVLPKNPAPDETAVCIVVSRAGHEANAKLIAAAPDLLETIIECRKHINLIIEDGAPTDWRMWRDDLDALISKAGA
jgi:hypothetical protein